MDEGRRIQWEIWKTMTPAQRWALSVSMRNFLVRMREARLASVEPDEAKRQARLVAEVQVGYQF